MENPSLVRVMFSLLHRQYQGLGGQMGGPLRRAYSISQASVEDTMDLLASLGQIRSLLSVRMGREEEKLMIRGLGWAGVFMFNCLVVALQKKTKARLSHSD